MSTFLQVVELLLTNDDAKADYANDPSTFLDQHGLGSLESADVVDAMTHAADALPLPVAVLLDPEAGLESAAELDLDARGLSLEREPIELDEPLDPFGADVDFDTPDDVAGAADAIHDEGVEEVASETPAGVTEVVEDADATNIADSLGDDRIDTADYLTDTLHEDVPFEETVTDVIDDSLANDHALDHLDTDLTDDLPDDFDLLD